jgi:hypothetical protein
MLLTRYLVADFIDSIDPQRTSLNEPKLTEARVSEQSDWSKTSAVRRKVPLLISVKATDRDTLQFLERRDARYTLA